MADGAGGRRRPPPDDRQWRGLDPELRRHIQTCPCSCDHMGYGNFLDYQVGGSLPGPCAHREGSVSGLRLNERHPVRRPVCCTLSIPQKPNGTKFEVVVQVTTEVTKPKEAGRQLVHRCLLFYRDSPFAPPQIKPNLTALHFSPPSQKLVNGGF